MFASIAGGESRIRGLSPARDVAATGDALRALGVGVATDTTGTTVVVPPVAWSDERPTIDCGNSATTARLLAGLLVGVRAGARLDGDPSLRGRPMDRVVYPLQAMGGRLRYLEDDDRLPLEIEPRASGSLRVLRYRPRIASAQVKSALLLAAVAGRTRLELHEPGRSRDHSERVLQAMGAPITYGPEQEGGHVRFDPGGWHGSPAPLDFEVPGDSSSAAFAIAASLLRGDPLRIEGVGLNPTRVEFLDVLREMGASVSTVVDEERAGEPVGRIEVAPAPLDAFRIEADRVAALLDEIPVLAVLAARARGRSVLRGAAELRVKESDRLAALERNLRALGVSCEATEDGLVVEGSSRALRGRVETAGDHRIAMAFGVLGRAPGCDVEVDDRTCVAVSYPEFWEMLEEVAGEDGA